MAESSNYAAIVAAVASRLDATTGVVNVHVYQRHVAEWKALITMLVVPGSGLVSGWTVSRYRCDEEWLTNKEVTRTHHFKLRAYYGCKDSTATESTFQNLLDAVGNKFREEFDMDGTAELREPLQWPIIDYRLFSGTLCHYAEGTLAITERLTGGA